MTHPFRIRLAQLVGVVLALAAGSAVAAENGDHTKAAYVVAGEPATQPDTLARIRAEARTHDAQLRIVHTTADELGALHLLAVSGYKEIVTLGVDRRIAIDPVAQRFPHTRFEIR